MIILKSAREIAIMREAGRIAARVHEALREAIRPGVETRELDALADRLIREAGGVPTFKGYHDYPASICTSVNEVVVHGIPSSRRLREGDIVAIDLGVTYQGYVGDCAYTWPVGEVSDEARRLLQVTQEALQLAIEQCRPGRHLGDIGHAVQSHVEAAGFSVVREYVGHGIGASMHEDPQVPNYGQPGTGVVLRPGMVLAIEPMVNAGTWEVRVLPDRWTVVTADGRYSAHFEHTVAITEGDPLILTLP
ncbi:type I methionyl aminopeptidase [Caldinitratiruptor microaerophilus]|uniref:Methionine aminopeptidase n=1 Tax=Caldinitratiruptor microaerophilus TaxID=671077 RepID=A0AA35CN87_9FIRM|nr:type I methionyl aminopeptidase [Caldinitratiruptor microaerophilus]BDG62242.1 type I methionyl aminopeptidase [Caldinitratiruptor microaerophilus]